MFQEFLQAQFSDENLRFWIEAEKYLNMTEEERMKRAKSLYEDFVSSISPCEVGINMIFILIIGLFQDDNRTPYVEQFDFF